MYCLDGVGIAKKLTADLASDLDPLEDRFKIIRVVYDGSPESYRLWEGLDHVVKAPLTLELSNPEARIVACVEFCWRVSELILSPLPPDEVVAFVIDRITKCGGPDAFLAECLLHRFSMTHRMPALVTTSRHIVDVLAGLAGAMNLDVGPGPAESREEHVTLLLFDGLLRQHVGALTSKDRAARLRFVLIEKFRDRVRRAAKLICEQVNSEQKLKEVVDQTVDETAPELAAIADLDRSTITRLGRRLTESSSLWTSVAGLIGSALATLPPVVPAAAAVTALAALGTAALASRRERDEALAKSPWSLVYHLDGLKDEEGGDALIPPMPDP
jgi:hypothetical protein